MFDSVAGSGVEVTKGTKVKARQSGPACSSVYEVRF